MPGDRVLLERLIANLVSNAVKYNEPGGVGLGLAVVRSVVIAHEGTIRVRPRPGGGLELEVGLPGSRSLS